MSWPLASHFSAMLQNPKVAFRDPELRACRIEKDERNQPRPWAGAFAVVYKGTSADAQRSFAVRVFTTESPQRRERYDLISDYLKDRRLDCLVDFEYRDGGIRSAGDGKWYPLILMDWVEGETLFKWARGRALERDAKALADAADRWVELVRELADARIAHGDLQHANVMVTPDGRLKLVDYDGMCVPELVGRRNLEVGVEPYQHPQRNAETLLALELDHFSSLVIYTALRGLAADPLLWTKYVEAPCHDKLLFRREDFAAPSASPLYHDLCHSPDPEVRELAERLFALAQAPLDEVPPLGSLADAYAKIERLLKAEQWADAVRLLNRRGQFRDAPPRLKPLIEEAYRHVCRQKSWTAFQNIALAPSEECDRSLVAAWNEPLFAGFGPAEARRPRVEAARRHLALLDRLRQLAEEMPQRASLAQEVKIAVCARSLPQGYAHGLQGRVEQARRCVRAIQRIEKAVKESAGEAAIASAWRKVVRAECEGLVRPELLPRVELAQRRAPLLDALGAIPPDLPPDQTDRRLLDVWQEEVLRDCPEAAPWRERHGQAVLRQELLARLQQAVGGGNDLEITRLLDAPALAGYSLPAAWTATIRAAQQRVARTEVLIHAMRHGERSSFLELFDARLIRRFADRFAAHEELLCQWIRSEVLPAERMGLRPALARASVVPADPGAGTYRIRWTWPQQRFTEECILAVCEEEPSVGEDPREISALYRLPIDRANWERGGGSRLLHVKPEWLRACVVVWALVDVGFRVFASHPLVLGRLGDRVQRRGGDGRGWRGRFARRHPAAQPPDQTRDTLPSPQPEDDRG